MMKMIKFYIKDNLLSFIITFINAKRNSFEKGKGFLFLQNILSRRASYLRPYRDFMLSISRLKEKKPSRKGKAFEFCEISPYRNAF